MTFEREIRILETYGRREWMTAEELATHFDSHSGKEGGPMEPLRAQAKLAIARAVSHLSELPQHWADLLSEFWGATSLHGAVFRQPRGVVFWHCDRCRVPTNPSGTRTWDGAAATTKQVERLCEAVWMWRQAERDRFIEAHARNYT